MTYCPGVDGASPQLTTPALDLARAIRAREVSSEELVRACLARIAEVDPMVSAFVDVHARRAIAAARHADREVKRARGAALPPLHGVPCGLKDAVFVRGAITRLGTRALPPILSPLDDRIAARLRKGGLVFVGKLATSELGAMPVTEPDGRPPTRNPWRLDRTPGGSSGGSGAAVAAGMVPIAQGSDGAGSVRIPAALCGLFGFKPSRGVVPESVGPPDPRGLAIAGPLARTVDDAAAMLELLAGVAPGAMTAPAPTALRVRVATRTSLCVAEPEVAAAVERVARWLERAGHLVDEAPALDAELDEFLPLWQHAIGTAPVVAPARLQPVTRWLRDAGRKLDARDVAARHDQLAARVRAWYGDAQLMITPTVAVPPPAIGAWRDLPPAEAFARAAQLGAFTAPFNITGQPAATLPMGVASWGVPIGVQLAGPRYADAQVLALARQLEQAMPWRDRRPPPMDHG